MSTCTTCVTAQSYCATGCQKGAEYLPQYSKNELKQLKSLQGLRKYDKITPELWKKTYDFLREFYNIGTQGDRKYPSLATINSLSTTIDSISPNKSNNQQYEKITNNLYLNLLKTISLDADTSQATALNIGGKNDLITIDNIVDKVQKYLENYKIDFNRCDTCNATGNCIHCSHCDDNAIPAFCFQGCGNSCSHGGSCSQCCMYGSPSSTPEGGDGSCQK